MPGLVSQVIAGLDQSWPGEHVTLYFQDESSEISLADFAASLSIRTLLHMCGLKHKIDRKHNAEFMSPNGVLPFLSVNGEILSGFDDINSHIEAKKLGINDHLDETSHAELIAHTAMTESVLGNAERYIAWKDPIVSKKVTKPRYGQHYPWPLNVVLPYLKQREMLATLAATQWFDLSEGQVCEKVRRCCEALSVKLGTKKFFFGNRVSTLDAIVFGHLFAIVTTILPNNCLAAIIKDYENLQGFLRRVNEAYFSNAIDSPKILLR